MTIAFGAAGAVAPGTTSLSVAYPTGITAGQLLILAICNKYPTNGPTLPSGGWFAPSGNQYSGGAGANGADSGSAYITVYLKIADGTETGNVSVTVAGGNTCLGIIARVTKAAGTTWDYACAGGSDNTAGTAWSVTAGNDPGVKAGDMIFVFSALNGNTDTATVEAISQTGVTFGSMVERADSGTNNGDDCSIWMSEHPVSSGAGSAAPVYTATVGGTGSATAAGASLFLRLREVNGASSAITLDAATVSADSDVFVGLDTLQGGVNPAYSGLLDSWIGSRLSFSIIAPQTGNTGGFETWVSNRLPLTEYQRTRAIALGELTLSATAQVGVPGIEASATITLDALTGSATVTADVQGNTAVTLALLSAAASATIEIGASSAVSLDSLTSSGTTAIEIQGSSDRTLDALTNSATGAVDVSATASIMLGPLTLSAEIVSGAAPNSTNADIILDALTLAADADVEVQTSAAITLGALIESATGAVEIQANSSIVLDALTVSGTATAEIQTSSSVILDALTSTGTTIIDVQANAAITLGALTITASGTVTDAGGNTLSADITLGTLRLSAAGMVGIESAEPASAVLIFANIYDATLEFSLVCDAALEFSLVCDATLVIGDTP